MTGNGKYFLGSGVIAVYSDQLIGNKVQGRPLQTLYRFWYAVETFWLQSRHLVAAYAVFINGLLIFRNIEGLASGLPVQVEINDILALNWSDVASGPWFLLGMFLMLNALGMLFRARIAWAVGVFLLAIALAYTINYHPEPHVRAVFCAVTLAGVTLLGKDFDRYSATADTIFAVISFSILLLYGTYGTLYFGSGFSPKIDNLTTAFYFSVVSMTTVGYGDIVPVTESARLFTISMIVGGITVFATSLTTFGGSMIRRGIDKLAKGRRHTMIRKDHFIVCGTSVLAMGTISQLMQKGLGITVVTAHTEEEFAQFEQRVGRELDLVSGDVTDNAVLDKAGIIDCQALLALSDDDATNAFIVLTARDMNPNIKTVLVVNDAKNMNKVRQVKADVILSPQLFGSEILASVLSGETLDHEKLASMLLASGHGLVK